MMGLRARGRRCAGPLSAVALLLTGAVVGGVLGHDTSVSAQQGEPLAVSLSDFMIEPARTTEVAGAVTFAVHNDGGVEHEFLVVRTDLAPDALPLAAGEVDESQVEVVARIEPFGSGETRSLTVDLTPSTYLLLCNVSPALRGGHADSLYRPTGRNAAAGPCRRSSRDASDRPAAGRGGHNRSWRRR